MLERTEGLKEEHQVDVSVDTNRPVVIICHSEVHQRWMRFFDMFVSSTHTHILVNDKQEKKWILKRRAGVFFI